MGLFADFPHNAEPIPHRTQTRLYLPPATHPKLTPTRPPDPKHRPDVDDVALPRPRSRFRFGFVLVASAADRDPRADSARREAPEPFQLVQRGGRRLPGSVPRGTQVRRVHIHARTLVIAVEEAAALDQRAVRAVYSVAVAAARYVLTIAAA